MKPVDQTKFGAEEGNCTMACLASVFEVPLESLPELTHENNDGSWYEICRSVARANGHDALWVYNKVPLAPRGYHLASGNSPRNLPHMVVALDGKVVHDPHPSRGGIGPIDGWLLLIPLAEAES
jgi:hypothetical protein